MSDKLVAFRNPFPDVVPALAGYTDDVLFGEVWKQPAFVRATAGSSP